MTYISPFEDVLLEEQLQALLELAETDPHERVRVGEGGFDQWNLTVANPALAEEIAALQQQLFVRYIQANSLFKEMFPEKWGFEELRLKRYRDGGDDWFPPHVDVADRFSARRFLAFLFYVKAPEKGGETVWIPQQMKVEPKAGACVVFPPLWPWLHYGSKSEGEKLILSGYFHYL